MTALTLIAALSLAHSCAGSVAPETLLSIVRTESGFDPFTIGVNGRPHRSLHPATLGEAVGLAGELLARGENLDLGLAQINARNLRRLGLSVRAAFEPCRNLAGAAQVLTADYLAAQQKAPEAQTALRAALSAYNTGDPVRGLHNGYVTKVQAAASVLVPAIMAAQAPSATGESLRPSVHPADPAPSLPAADSDPSEPQPAVSLDVFARGAPVSLVWPSSSSPSPGTTRRRPSITPISGDPS